MQHEDPMKPSPVLIKKYGNRRLYNTAASRYVNLDEIADLIRKGREIRVVDAKTGEDCTRVTLTQIITEDARQRPSGLPLELLRQIIVASDEVSREFITWYLKSALDAYQKVQSAVQSRLGEVQSLLSPVDLMKRFLNAKPAPAPPSSTPELDALHKRVVELEARLGHVRKRRRSRGKRAKHTGSIVMRGRNEGEV
jgi:polyhydroxyalkanoate synthesis repressor PhaR